MVLNRTRISSLLSAAALLAFGTTAANAQTSFPAPSTVTPPVTGFFGGTQIGGASSLFTATNNGQTISGTLFSAVFSGGTAQTINGVTFGGTNLDFYYQIVTNASSNQAVQSMSLASFVGAGLAVAQTGTDIDGASTNFVAGTVQSVSAQRNFSGAGIVFDFNTGIGANSAGFTQIVRTNATSFSFNGSAAFIGTQGVAANGQGLVIAPTAVQAAPEPGTLALLGMGVVGMAGTVVRRRRAK